MSIEFRCTNCQKLLRVGDDAAGRNVKCPACSTLLTIPAASTPEPAFSGVDPNQPPPGFQPGGTSDNPYESPQTAGATFSPPPDDSIRTGPPWERDGMSMRTLYRTVKEAYFSTALHYGQMRRSGGLGYPLMFNIAMNYVAILATILVGLVIVAVLGLGGALSGAFGGMAPGDMGMAGGIAALLIVFYLVLIIVGVPIGAAMNTFIGGGIFHLMLMMFQGAKHPFETTFRAVCYANGAGLALAVVLPVCGFYLSFIPGLIFLVIALKELQEIPLWKALCVVLIPTFVCGGCYCGINMLTAMAQSGAAFQQGQMNPGGF